MEASKYILFCAQEANFQTRSMLIPYELIMKCPKRVKDLEVLRTHAYKNVGVKPADIVYVVDQLLIQNVNMEYNYDEQGEIIGGVGQQDDTPYRDIVNHLIFYADDRDGRILYEYPEDEIWAPHAIRGIASCGFNHIANYLNFRNKTSYENNPIEIVEGFLVLETTNHKFRQCKVDTVEQLLHWLN